MDVIILLYLLFYSIYSSAGQKKRIGFYRLWAAAFGHVIFGAITEYTVNHTEIPYWALYTSHFLFYAFAMFFAVEFVRYSMSNVISKKRLKKFMVYIYILAVIGVCAFFLSDLIVKDGRGSRYSTGYGLTIDCALAFAMIIFSALVLFKNRKKVDNNVIFSILPLSAVLIILMSFQLFVPEFLFTENMVTMAVIGVFFAIENPVKRIKDRAFIEYNTGLYNRNCYEFDRKEYENVEKYNDIAVMICDLNYLKLVNDTYGHLEGDIQIALASEILQSSFNSAKKIYRAGGDEFLLVFMNPSIETIEEEIKSARERCIVKSSNRPVPVEIAIGYAVLREGETYKEMVKRADDLMYADKKAMKGKRQQ